MIRPDKVFAKKINERFSKKQNEMKRLPAQMGGGDGVLRVPGLNNFVYVTIADKTLPAFNNRVPPKKGLRIWVGYSPEEPNLFQVLSTRTDTPAGDVDTTIGGYAPAIRYEWLAKYGGEDPLNVHLRAFTPLKLGVSATGGLNVDLYSGYVYSSGYIHIDRQDIDMTSHVPSTSGKCALVLVTINTSGTVVTTKGSEVNVADLVVTDLPAIPSILFLCVVLCACTTGKQFFRREKPTRILLIYVLQVWQVVLYLYRRTIHYQGYKAERLANTII